MLALVVAVLALALGTAPGRKLLSGLRKPSVTVTQKLDGNNIVYLIESAQAPMPRHWESNLKDHSRRGVEATFKTYTDLMESRMQSLSDLDRKVDELQQGVARIEGMLERRIMPRYRGASEGTD